MQTQVTALRAALRELMNTTKPSSNGRGAFERWREAHDAAHTALIASTPEPIRAAAVALAKETRLPCQGPAATTFEQAVKEQGYWLVEECERRAAEAAQTEINRLFSQDTGA